MQNGCLSLSIFVTREEGMWKHVAAQAFGALMPEINSMWSSYENALNSPCAAWLILVKMDTFPSESEL